jgi:DNA (cytosine-5)-methyltransferase 1
MNLLDLFSGIGAFSLGLERSAAFRTVAFCECDPFCRRVLAKHWPEVPCYDDVRTLTAARLAADGISVDAICGGFPCQDISVAGRGAGIGGERSGLWSEFARLIGELRPRYVLVENVAALLGRGMGVVLGDLSALGYDAEWQIISAADMGAPHRRERVWIVAYPGGEGRREVVRGAHGDEGAHGPQHLQLACGDGAQRDVADAARLQSGRSEQRAERERTGSGGEPLAVADTIGARLEGRPDLSRDAADQQPPAEQSGAVPDAGRLPPARYGRGLGEAGERDWWLVEPDVGRVAHGVASRVDRLRSLGNALVPQIPEAIGRAIGASTVSRTAPTETAA